MVLTLYSCMALILAIAFVVKKKRLDLLEISLVWMVVLYFHENILNISTLNLKLWKHEPGWDKFVSLLLCRTVIVPIVIVWYFDWMDDLSRCSRIVKAIGFAGFIILMSLFWEFNHRLRLLDGNAWKLWWSIVEWAIIVGIAHSTLFCFRKLLPRREEAE